MSRQDRPPTKARVSCQGYEEPGCSHGKRQDWCGCTPGSESHRVTRKRQSSPKHKMNRIHDARKCPFRFVCIPRSFKGRSLVQIQSQYKILPLFFNQNVTLFRMMKLTFLFLYTLCWKWRLNSSTVSVNSFIHLTVHNIRLTTKTSAPLERTHEILI
jgi:hypothetical protein